MTNSSLATTRPFPFLRLDPSRPSRSQPRRWRWLRLVLQKHRNQNQPGLRQRRKTATYRRHTPICVGTPTSNEINTLEAHSGNRSVPAPADYGNGDTDLICSNANGDVFFYRNTGDGRFKPGVKIASGDNCAFVWPVDWNGDGKMELVVTWRAGPKAEILLNQGIGPDGLPMFVSGHQNHPPGFPVPVPWPSTGNHDGQVDLLFASSYPLLHFAEHHFVEHGYVEAKISQRNPNWPALRG